MDINDRREHPAFSELAENHFSFMAAHRGSIHRSYDAIELVGKADFLSCWIPLDASAGIPETASNVRLYPWSGESWHERLLDSGFAPSEKLHYMEAQVAPTPPRLPDGVTISVVRSDDDALAFAAQANGFLPTGLPSAAWWRTTFREVALHSHRDPEQNLYLLRYRDEPAAVTLTLRSHGTCGIYAVTTIPSHRGRGLASLLLGQIHRDAEKCGDIKLGLQVEPGSDAERLYLKSGFASAFISDTYRR